MPSDLNFSAEVPEPSNIERAAKAEWQTPICQQEEVTELTSGGLGVGGDGGVFEIS